MLIPVEFSNLSLKEFTRLARLGKRAEGELEVVHEQLHSHLDTPSGHSKRSGNPGESYTALMTAVAMGVRAQFNNAVRQMAVVNLLMAAPGRYQNLLVADDDSIRIEPFSPDDPADDAANLSYGLLKSVADDCKFTLALTGIVETSHIVDNPVLRQSLDSSLRLIRVGCESVILRVGALDRMLHSTPGESPHALYKSIRLPSPHENYGTTEGIELTLHEAATSEREARDCNLDIARSALTCIAQQVPFTRSYLIENPDVSIILKATGFRLT